MNKKRLLFKLTGIIFIAIITITCTPKSTYNADSSIESNVNDRMPHTNDFININDRIIPENNEILNGDFSDFAGVYYNGRGEVFTLKSDGTRLEDDTQIAAGSFVKHDNGSFSWNSNQQSNLNVILWPVGVEVRIGDRIIETNTTRIRLHAGHDEPENMIREIQFLISERYLFYQGQYEDNVMALIKDYEFGNDPVLLAQRAYNLITLLEGRDDNNPAAAEELRMLGEAIVSLSEADQRIYYAQLEHFYIGYIADDVFDFNFYAGYYRDIYADHLQAREIIHYGSGHDVIYLYSDVDLYDFKVFAVNTDADLNFYSGRINFSLDVLSSKSALEYSTNIPDGIPAEAVSFLTADGTRHIYLLQLSGYDGKVIAMWLDFLM